MALQLEEKLNRINWARVRPGIGISKVSGSPYTNKELKKILQFLGEPSSGNKDQLLEKLQPYKEEAIKKGHKIRKVGDRAPSIYYGEPDGYVKKRMLTDPSIDHTKEKEYSTPTFQNKRSNFRSHYGIIRVHDKCGVQPSTNKLISLEIENYYPTISGEAILTYVARVSPEWTEKILWLRGRPYDSLYHQYDIHRYLEVFDNVKPFIPQLPPNENGYCIKEVSIPDVVGIDINTLSKRLIDAGYPKDWIKENLSQPQQVEVYTSEYIPYGLDQVLKYNPDNPRYLEPEDVRQLAFFLLEAVENFHYTGLVHKDLKPANIRLRTDDFSQDENPVVLIDFGITDAMGPRNWFFAQSVTPGYGSARRQEPSSYFGGTVLTDLEAIGHILLAFAIRPAPWIITLSKQQLLDFEDKQLETLKDPEHQYHFVYRYWQFLRSPEAEDQDEEIIDAYVTLRNMMSNDIHELRDLMSAIEDNHESPLLYKEGTETIDYGGPFRVLVTIVRP